MEVPRKKIGIRIEAPSAGDISLLFRGLIVFSIILLIGQTVFLVLELLNITVFISSVSAKVTVAINRSSISYTSYTPGDTK